MNTGTRSVVLGAVLTGAFVAVGSLVAATALPRIDSPQEVTRAYASALYDQDWPGVLQVVCQEERDYWAERASWERPARHDHDFDFDFGEPELDSVNGEPLLKLPYKQSSDSRFQTAALLVQEDGHFRVCGEAMVR
jgi:hypothetical protein